MGLSNIGLSLTGLGLHDSALTYHQSALAVLEQMGKAGSLDAADVYENIGYVYNGLQQYDQAMIYHRQALLIRYNSLPNSPSIAISHKEIGATYLHLRKYDSARSNLLEAVKISKKKAGSRNRFIGEIYLLLGNVYLETGEIIPALQHYQRALRAVVLDYNDNSLYSLPRLSNYSDPLLLLQILRNRGRALYELGVTIPDPEIVRHGFDSYELGLEVIDLMRLSNLTYGDKLGRGKEAAYTYQEAVELSYDWYSSTQEIGALEMSFRTAERSRAGALKEMIAVNRSRKDVGIPDSIIEKERALKLEIAWIETLLLKEKSKPDQDAAVITSLSEKLFQKKRRSEQFLLALREQYPRYYNLNYIRGFADIKSIKAQLEPTEALIEYFLSDSSIFAFVITHQDFIVIRTPKDSLTWWIQHFTAATDLSEFSSSDSYQLYLASSRRLFEILLKPVVARISSTTNKLIISPDKEIGYIAFEALLSSNPNPFNDDSNNLPYLIRDYSVSYVYSSSLMFSNYEAPGRAQKMFLGFAPTYRDQNGLNELNYSQQEVQRIAGTMKGTQWLGKDATEEAFKRLAPDYRILHLAMHAQVNGADPMYSKLAFSPVENTTDDGWLHTFEILNLDLNSDLVVLSACNTGLGKLEKGEGIMSLARGFVQAGCPSILMSHWSVNDQTTLSLMESFYNYLGDGLEKDLALRQAKLDYLREAGPVLSHPYFWAGFVLFGDTRSVQIDNENYLKIASLSFALLAVALLVFGRKALAKAIGKLRGHSEL